MFGGLRNIADEVERFSMAHRPEPHQVNARCRVPGMISGILGAPSAGYLFHGCSIEWHSREEDFFGMTFVNVNRVPDKKEMVPGYLTWDHANAGLTPSTKVSWEVLPHPPGVTAVVGCAGPLLAGTPLAPTFEITKPYARTHFDRRQSKATWGQVWAMGMASRWGGWDYSIRPLDHIGINLYQPVWATNNYMLCTPPYILPRSANNMEYLVRDPMERDYVRGESWYSRMNEGETKIGAWETKPLALHATPDRKSHYAQNIETLHGLGPSIVSQIDILEDVNEYVVMVNTKYERVSQGFRVGIVRPNRQNPIPEQPIMNLPALQVEEPEIVAANALAEEE